METVYIETTIVSYLVAAPSENPLIAGEQQATRYWWDARRSLFLCITSEEVLAEAARGDSVRTRLRLKALEGMPLVTVSAEAESLAAELLKTGALPVRARSDALHLAVASVVKADYLLTWNCRHLANAQILRRLEKEAELRGWNLPTVCTPLELMGESGHEPAA